MNDSQDETVSAAVADRMKTLKVEEQNDNNKGYVTKDIQSQNFSEIKEKQSKIIDYPRLFLLRMRDHHLSQVNSISDSTQLTCLKTPPLDLPSIQGVTFVQTCDNNNSESMRGDLIFDPGNVYRFVPFQSDFRYLRRSWPRRNNTTWKPQ